MTTVLGLSEFWSAVLAAVVGIIAAGRFVRLVVSDSFPLSVRLRVWWDNRTHESLWNPLLHCPWCFAPYVTLLNLAFFLIADESGGFWLQLWWVLNGWLAASYAVSWIVFHDED